MRSNYTFNDEYQILSHEIPEGFWSSYEYNSSNPYDYVFGGGELPLVDEYRIVDFEMEDILEEYQGRNVKDAFQVLRPDDGLGFDLWETIEKLKNQQRSGTQLADLIEEFGRESFGCYLPFHAYYNSKSTPWGIYIFLEEVIERSIFLHKEKNEGLNLDTHFINYLFAVYRHELFHYHVESFSTKLELINLKPYYRPYQENVYDVTQNSEDWLEEALAEASVLKSRLVANRAKVKLSTLREIYKYDLQFMPPGYKDYHCKKFGGPKNAFLRLTEEIILGTPTDPLSMYRTTNLVNVKNEYQDSDKKVPAYIIVSEDFIKRVQ